MYLRDRHCAPGIPKQDIVDIFYQNGGGHGVTLVCVARARHAEHVLVVSHDDVV